ncbi:TPA: DUF4304 domain-containing protein [Streptococcus suis]|uniref:DUF4304 domain-containing protein n=1 Tax=Streptococcus TaxID=1301 RepID=UPI000423BBCB|nr:MULTISPECIES: DUF4304 domain-containing protein [Streptococcus]MBM7135639.1 DUF4304 domain-containing protein [Streptococcus suis]MBM7137270.1 DUF4304 domain-containing protein [Streptococcus suis]MBY0731558.1 DUF4304 domain-containing protein [Streptococcus sp. 2018162]MBY4600362.1 DUF4304 domain-containing protein [Streptococcus suis]MCO8171867.1 DUF4304 domain-containing protein [Streptococcus suis]
MELKEFKNIVFDILKKNGFKYIKSKYCFENDELLVFIEFQKSNFSNAYYINYYFVIKDLHKRIEKLTIKIRDFGARFAYYNYEGELVNNEFELEEISNENLTFSIQKELDEEVFPAFNKGIYDYLSSRPIMKKMSSKATKKYLEEQTKIS